MKKNNKGFTLVELIVVLVILAILAAILVPALLGWIDKAREKSVTTNAEAALVAAQGLATEQYGGYKNPKTAVTSAAIKDLTDIEENFSIPTISFKSAYPTGTNVKPSQVNKDMYKIMNTFWISPSDDIFRNSMVVNTRIVSSFFHKIDETVEEISAVLRPGCAFRVILDAENLVFFALHTFYCVVEDIDMSCCQRCARKAFTINCV